MARKSERVKSVLLNVNKWLRYNGVEYTDAQHEKFAVGFTACVKSGKAPSYGLKLAFENFKKWLNDLYETLHNSDDFILNKEGEKIFEQLLGGVDYNIKKKAASELV